MTTLMSVDDALEYILGHFRPLEAETAGILDALGRVLAENIHSTVDIPPFANSAMDGYALRAADTAGASHQRPATLTVLADLAAGQVTEAVVGSGTAIRIMTGAPVPAGADAVVRFEETSEGLGQAVMTSDQVQIFAEVRPGDNGRPAKTYAAGSGCWPEAA